jgi:hypothetical protein
MSRTTGKAETDEPLRLAPVTTSPAVRAVFVSKDMAWATGQGVNDRNAGTGCRKYKEFLSIHELPRSPVTLRMWNAYLLARQSAPKDALRRGAKSKRPAQAKMRSGSTPLKFAQKSNWARGLTLSDAPPRRRTVRRYDGIEARRSDLSPENAALLMKVNQQDTLIDMWR